MGLRSGVGCGLVAVALAGCPVPRPPALSPDFAFPFAPPAGSDASTKIVLVSDNQLHHLYGAPIWIQSEFFDALARRYGAKIIRSPQLDLFGQDLLQWVVQEADSPVVHLGDALDFGCTGELDRFLGLMRGARHGWVMAPGNHDGYFFGVFDFGSAGKNRIWQQACERGGAPVTKDLLVRSYLSALAGQRARPGFTAFGAAFKPSAAGEWRYRGTDKDAFLHGVKWSIDGRDRWRSYVLQEIELATAPRMAAILLDTTQHGEKPDSVLFRSRNAGLSGGIRTDQLDAVEAWLRQAPPGQLTALMAHFPWRDLGEDARKRIDGFRARYGVVLYVSGHTHQGQYFTNGKDREAWVELNVGSILDWPPEYRTLRFYRPAAPRSGTLAFAARLHRLSDALVEAGGAHRLRCEPQWEAKPDRTDYYTAHRGGTSWDARRTQWNLMKSLLGSHRLMLELAATDTGQPAPWPPCCPNDAALTQKIRDLEAEALPSDVALAEKRLAELVELARALDELSRSRKPVKEKAEVYTRYRRCQALWASLYDSVGARVPHVSVRHIQLQLGGGGKGVAR